MEVVEIHHVPAGAHGPGITTLTNKSTRKTKIDREIKTDIHEFKRRLPREEHINCNWLKFLNYVPTWLWLTGLGLLMWAAICFFISVMVVYFYGYQESIRPLFPAGQIPDEPCSSTSQCITNAYCVLPANEKVGVCQCATDFFYDSAVSLVQCNPTRTINIACTDSNQCTTSVGLMCSGGLCVCSSTSFFNTTSNRCEYLKVIRIYFIKMNQK